MWLHKLLSLNPAKWPVGRSIRMAIGVGTPLAVGLLTEHILFSLWVTLGVMMQSSGEGPGSYRSLFRITLIAAPIGALGYFSGYLWPLPPALAIIILTVVAFLAGIINSYGAAYSKGTLQGLLGASLAYGLAPEIHTAIAYWQAALLYLTGAAFYLLLLSIEALLDKERPERLLLASYLTALAALAKAYTSTNQQDASAREAARRAVIDKYEALYGVLLEHRSANAVRSKENQNNATILQAGDSVFVAILAERDAALLTASAEQLHHLAQAIEHRQPLPVLSNSLAPRARLTIRLTELANSIVSLDSVTARAAQQLRYRFKISTLWKQRTLSVQHLMVGPYVLKAAAILALCMGLAFSMKYFVHGNHWYWIPLTVSLVMKPELGSVFVRAVLRTLGTALGVVIGSVILMVVPKGTLLLVILMMLASCIPWAIQRSYALQALFLTPLVLILIDLTTPGLQNINYGGQRLMDTAIGGAIVLIFGYFIWPRAHEQQLSHAYQTAMDAMASYLRAVCSSESNAIQRSRREVYGQLSNLRIQLQKQLSEPPPVDQEAAHWFPIVVAAERLADCITVFEENKGEGQLLPNNEAVESLALHMQNIVQHSDAIKEDQDEQQTSSAFLDKLVNDLNVIARLLHKEAPQ